MKETLRRMILNMWIAACVVTVAGALFYRNAEALPFALGVLMSTALNTGKAFWLGRVVTNVAKNPGTPRTYVPLQYLLRFALTGGVLYLAFMLPFVNQWGAIAGLFTFHAGIHALRWAVAKEA